MAAFESPFLFFVTFLEGLPMLCYDSRHSMMRR
jgi:hypothetical protein